MTKKANNESLDKLAAQFERSYGKGAAMRGGLQKALKSVPTGSLALDYELGTGGWPLGYLHGVFGPRDIGKSSMVGLNGVRNAQAMGLTAGWVAIEAFKEPWAEKNGVAVEDLFVVYPENGEEAFSMLHTMITSGQIDFIVFDSIGSILSESEIKEGGVARMGGQAGLITWGSKAAAQLAYRNDVAVIMLNQVRHQIGGGPSRGVQYKQPGGEGLEHSEEIIVQLKRGKNRYTVKQNGTDIVVGQEIVAHILRNKHTEGSGQKAIFDYFYSTALGNKLGVDLLSDTVNTAKRTGVIVQRGAMYDLPNGETIKSMAAVETYFEKNPDALLQVREGVLQAMLERNTRTPLPDAETDEGEENDE